MGVSERIVPATREPCGPVGAAREPPVPLVTLERRIGETISINFEDDLKISSGLFQRKFFIVLALRELTELSSIKSVTRSGLGRFFLPG